METPQKITVSPRTMIVAIFLIAITVGLWQIRTTVLVVLLAVVLASFVDGGVRFFQKIKIPRGVAVVMIYVTTLAIVSGFLYMFIPAFLDEIIGVVQLLPEDSALSNVLGFLGEGSLRESLTQLSASAELNPFELVRNIRGELSALNIVQSISVFFGGVFNFILAVVVSFYLSVLDDGVGQFLRIITPLEHEEYVLGIWKRSQRKIAGWFRGQLLLAFINGLLTYFGLLIIGVPYALLLGLIAIFFSLIPYGVVLSGLLAMVVGFFTGGVPMALATFLLITILQQLENYIWQPVIIKSVTGVPSLVIIIALVAGAQLAGLMGLLLAVPVSVVVLEIVNDVERKRMRQMVEEGTA